jgi:hypothetical protein
MLTTMQTVRARVASGEWKRATFFLPETLMRSVRAAAITEGISISDWAIRVFTAALNRNTKSRVDESGSAMKGNAKPRQRQ